jgi:hypothetical protein
MCKKLICLASFVLMLGLAGSASAALVAHWEFDNSATDSVGTLTWTLENGAGYSTDSKEGSHSLSLDGTDDHARQSAAGALVSPFSQQTVTLWFKANTTSGTQVLYDEGGLTNGLAIRIDNGTLQAAAQDQQVTIIASTSFSGTDWTHVAITFDNGQLKLYVGAAERDSVTGSFGTVSNHTNAAGLGARRSQDAFDGDGTGDYFGGLIDDVRIYDHVLLLPEIGALAGELWPYAYNPGPADGALHEATWVTLTWQPGGYAVSHDVSLGHNFADVNDGTSDSPAFQGNQGTTMLIAGFFGMPYPDGLVPGTTYYWRIDEVNDVDPNSPWKGDVWSFSIPARTAHDPSPADGTKFVLTDATLSWTAGLNVVLHYVYFGDNFDDVNNATGGLSQVGTTYVPGLLEKDKVYYWRVDEFDGAATNRGDVWSFSTVPAIAVADPNLVGFWKLDEGSGATAVDYSGYDHHGTITGDPQWVDGYDGGALDFDGEGDFVETADYDGITGTHARTCSAWINTTTANRTILSWGQNVAGQKWRMRADSTGGLRAEVNGGYHYGVTNIADGYWHHVAVTFEDDGSPDALDILLYVDGQLDATADSLDEPIDTAAGPVRIGETPWHNSPFIGVIDDVRIYDKVLTVDEIKQAMRGDLLVAWLPGPRNGSTPDIDAATPLSWSPGDNAAQHDVYLGLDRDAVADANASDTTGIYRGRQGFASYTPPEGVEWGGGPYYWRIDEFNTDGTISTGRIWSFTVADYLSVDDFESYNDIPEGEPGSNLVYLRWNDGFDNPATNGSTIGYPTGTSMETDTVHGGLQSVPVLYDNNLKVSEVELPLSPAQDWTRHGIAVLSLYFHGNPANALEQMYVKVNGVKVLYTEPAADLVLPRWKVWNIPLEEFANQGANLQGVTSFAIGFGDAANLRVGGTGTVFFDDIRLLQLAETPVEVFFEAEAADSITLPMQIYNDPLASAGRYIGTDDGIGNESNDPPADGIATYTFTVEAGTYKILGRVQPDAGNSFWVRIATGTPVPVTRPDGWIKWNAIEAGAEWHWDEVHDNDQSGNPRVEWTLPAGQHTLEIARREDGGLLDAIVITDDLD